MHIFVHILKHLVVMIYIKIQNDELLLNSRYEIYFVKLYNSNQFLEFENFINKSNISYKKVYFYGQYCRNNYKILLKQIAACKGVIICDEYDTIYGIIIENLSMKGIAYLQDGILYIGQTPKRIAIENIPKADRHIARKLRQKFVEVSFSRGCKKCCSFCTIGSSKEYDCKTNKLILEEIKSIIETTNIRELIFKDLSFDDRIKIYEKKV